jgi:aspartyl-tRNA(Asn)/glutamyl-tRNA(Gln) amidotransferase subunit A
MNLTSLSLAELASLLKARTISPVELTRAYLERIDTLNSQLNAFITITAEQALDAARSAESEIMRGNYKGALHGIPIALKDNIETAGIRTTAGSSFLRDYVPAHDAAVVMLLRRAGAVILGKTNMHEWAFGVVNNNPWFGDTRNPWDPARITGGSSGGSAAAVAARMCAAALGTDTRGSVRIPAALCGVVGFKPRTGTIPADGVIPLSKTLDQVGIFAGSVQDAVIVYEAIHTAGFRPVLSQLGARDKVGVARNPVFSALSDEVAAQFEALVRALPSTDIQTDVDIEYLESFWRASRIISSAEAAAYHAEYITAHPDGFGADVLSRLHEGQGYSAAEYICALKEIDRARALSCAHQAQGIGCLLIPTLPTTAPRHDDAPAIADARKRFSAFNAPFNVSGDAAFSIPMGMDERGLPMGVQIVGFGSDDAIFHQAYRVEAAAAWRGRLAE